MIGQINSPSFKGYIPVTYYAKHPNKDEYVPVLKRENLKKCNGYVVRNLNGTKKTGKNEELVDVFKSKDPDYNRNPIVHSVYNYNNSSVYLVTGDDVDEVQEYARPIGIAKGEAKERTGRAKSFEATCAARDYINNVTSFIKNRCRRLKTSNGDNLSMQVYFDPKYNKKQELKSFEFNHLKFVDEKGREEIYPKPKEKSQDEFLETDNFGQMFFCLSSLVRE